MIGRQVICSHCRQARTCRAVLEVQHAPRRVFCGDACMTLFVREVYIEAGAPAGTSSPDRRSAVAGQGEVPAPVVAARPTGCRWPEFLRSVVS